MKLTINTPCQEGWNTMTPTEKGRFCSSCQKEVLDFTAFSAPKLLQFFEGTTTSVCGHFHNSQLEAFNARYQALPTPSRMKQWAAVAVLTAVITLPSFGQAPNTWPAVPSSEILPAVEYSKKNKDLASTNITQSVKTVFLLGKIVSREQKQPVPLANIWVKGIEIGTMSGLKGEFQLEVPLSEEVINLQISCFGYESVIYQVVPNQHQTQLVIEIKEDTNSYEDGIIIFDPQDFR